MSMKKMLYLVTLLLLIGLFAVGCTEDAEEVVEAPVEEPEEVVEEEEEEEEEEPAEPAGPINASIGGGSIGGAWATIGEGVAEVVRREYSDADMRYETGEEAANIALVAQGRIELAVAHVGSLNLAQAGLEPYDQPMGYEDLRAITLLYGGAALHVVVEEGLGLESLAQIKEEEMPIRINRNTRDSFMELGGRHALLAYDISDDDIVSWGGTVDFISMGPSFDLMRDGRLDMFMNIMQYPSSHVVDLASTHNVQLVGLDDAAIDYMIETLGVQRAVIPASAYDFLDADINTIADPVVLVAHKDFPEQHAYDILAALEENLGYFQGIHAMVSDITVEEMAEVGAVELHPGALRFFQERGIIQ